MIKYNILNYKLYKEIVALCSLSQLRDCHQILSLRPKFK